jgi:hypothetical protein
MQVGGNNDDKSNRRQSKNDFKGSTEGGLREVTREFGGQPLRGGSNRALDTVVIVPLSHFFAVCGVVLVVSHSAFSTILIFLLQ